MNGLGRFRFVKSVPAVAVVPEPPTVTATEVAVVKTEEPAGNLARTVIVCGEVPTFSSTNVGEISSSMPVGAVSSSVTCTVALFTALPVEVPLIVQVPPPSPTTLSSRTFTEMSTVPLRLPAGMVKTPVAVRPEPEA